MKILLVMPSVMKDLSSVPEGRFYIPPLGIMYISSYLKRVGFDVHCFNMNHQGFDGLKSVFDSQNYDAVCTGGMYNYLQLMKIYLL